MLEPTEVFTKFYSRLNGDTELVGMEATPDAVGVFIPDTVVKILKKNDF